MDVARARSHEGPARWGEFTDCGSIRHTHRCGTDRKKIRSATQARVTQTARGTRCTESTRAFSDTTTPLWRHLACVQRRTPRGPEHSSVRYHSSQCSVMELCDSGRSAFLWRDTRSSVSPREPSETATLSTVRVYSLVCFPERRTRVCSSSKPTSARRSSLRYVVESGRPQCSDTSFADSAVSSVSSRTARQSASSRASSSF